MTLRNVDVTTDAVVDLTADGSLVADTKYLLQVQGNPVFITELVAAPDLATDPAAFWVGDKQFWPISQGPANNFYAWSQKGPARIVVNEAEA